MSNPASKRYPKLSEKIYSERDWLRCKDDWVAHAVELEKTVEAQEAERDTPEIEDFARGVQLEAVHQRGRWGSDHDTGKTPADWFWLVGYLAGKALHSVIGGNTDKAKHHLITTAAALCNWHAALLGKTNMRPGIEPPICGHATAAGEFCELAPDHPPPHGRGSRVAGRNRK